MSRLSFYLCQTACSTLFKKAFRIESRTADYSYFFLGASNSFAKTVNMYVTAALNESKSINNLILLPTLSRKKQKNNLGIEFQSILSTITLFVAHLMKQRCLALNRLE
ncbi:hypothetical protein OUZ56_006749 [Daphnia magna]|uniref:Uncharacterized protein n=1 Tax=Daphnia magna TaxID=35525 RepID=A0ABQ9YWK7_9CRUS|nr:hypothetical protein OUZ56_006749 [Daphnia magna]